MTRVFFYVQHLLGIGHQKRAAALSRAMAARGLDVTYVSGGYPVPDLDIGGASFVQLPPCKAADSTFLSLLDEHGRPVTEGWKENRRDRLLAAFAAARPEVVMTEMFPFGRRALEFEIVPLLERARAATPRPLIVCSVRDIIDPKPKPGRYEEIVSRIRDWYDLVLVHGDPRLLPFEATFPLAARIAERLRYTGYVADEPERPRSGAGRGEVIVTAGSGRIGEAVIEAAMAARPLSALKNGVWRFLIGEGLSNASVSALRDRAQPGVIIERFRADYPDLLANAALSISRAGYNTVMDLLRARTPAVLVPFAEGIENEQMVRAKALADHGLMEVVPQSDLTPARLAAAVSKALALKPAAVSLDLSGAAATARIVAQSASVY